MRLTAIFHFSVNRLWIDADLRGTAHRVPVSDDVTCSIHLPATASDFDRPGSPDYELAIRGFVGGPIESATTFQVVISMAAVSLFDKGCKAVHGRSLREEDRDLYKRVDKLFQDRNKVAHHGGSALVDDDLAEHIKTARRAIEWISAQRNKREG